MIQNKTPIQIAVLAAIFLRPAATGNTHYPSGGSGNRLSHVSEKPKKEGG
jgi:hypothetical protein